MSEFLTLEDGRRFATMKPQRPPTAKELEDQRLELEEIYANQSIQQGRTFLNRSCDFENEKDFIAQATPIIDRDFFIRKEVRGNHLTDGGRLRIDMLITPRPHLIEAGFPDKLIGVEFKIIPKWSVEQTAVGGLFAQCIDYAQSSFKVDGEERRPDIVLACAATNGYSIGVCNALFTSAFICATRFKVGVLDIYRPCNAFRMNGSQFCFSEGWKMYRSASNIYAEWNSKTGEWSTDPRRYGDQFFIGRKPGNRVPIVPNREERVRLMIAKEEQDRLKVEHRSN